MAKISLRAYNRELETMIDRGQTDEAIAHCKYILKTYPKHLETYRLLGKAYLESQRFSEAGDILQRILSVQPDDFVSQIGMSIIREDEGNLDAAIYHMERAFEVQPSNAAIQDELRRLYGRRDGIQPPKLRLTRGALVRMYARGDLYRQAIAESRAALKEDPQRLDLEIVLARMYFQTGQKAEAAEISSRLVSKLPYCYEANRILADVLPSTSRADDVQVVQQKLLALDPYLSYSESVQGSQQSPDNAVTLDRLEWTPSLETDQQPAWARSLGVNMAEPEVEETPDWMNDLQTGQAAPAATKESRPTPFSRDDSLFAENQEQRSSVPAQPVDQNLPEWMQSAGWGVSNNPVEEVPAPIEEEPDEPAEATPAELPGWLAGMAPDQPAPAEDQARTDWLDSIVSQGPSRQTSSEPMPSSPSENFDKLEAVPANDEDIPDWLKPAPLPEEENLFAAQNNEPLPDWLVSASEPQTPPSNESEQPANLDWFAQDQNAAAPAETTAPDFSESATIPYTQEIKPGPVSAFSLEKSQTQAAQPPVEQVAPVASEPDLNDFDQAMAWLEGLAAKQGAEEETLLTRPDERISTAPGWVTQAAQSEEDETGAPSTPDMGVSTTPEPVHLAKTIQAGADNLSEPAAPTLSDWMETAPSLENAQPSETEPQWISAQDTNVPDQEPFEISPAQPSSQPAEILDVQPPVPTAVNLAQTAPIETVSTGQTEEMDMDAAFAWLESLAANQGAEAETLLVAPGDRQTLAPDWVQQQSAETAAVNQVKLEGGIAAPAFETAQTTVPETSQPGEGVYNSQVEAEITALASQPGESLTSGQAVDELPAEPADRIPEWLKSSEEAPVSNEVETTTTQDLPDWLKDTESSPQSLPLPTSASSPAPTLQTQELWPADNSQAEIRPAPAEEEVPTWIQGLVQPEQAEQPAPQPPQTPQKAPEPQRPADFGHTRPLPSWLASNAAPTIKPAAESPQPPAEPTMPDWLKTDEQAQSSVQPASHDEGAGPDLPDWLKNLESEPEEEIIPAAPTLVEAPQPSLSEIEVSSQPDEMLVQAQTALSKGHIDLALTIYARLIEQQKYLEETIHDLRDALYRYPVDSAIWQTLGDALFQNNRVQDALDAYTKAEDFLK
jgi:tetratricopeptide (TPR) repeat protein